ncbi:hypothetical protein C8A05DRAFT_29775 [Staphylotrichum tortipilum]|uniref:Serine/threonine-protein kinase ppk6 n=1 Tax=Staphylotrichum tortipilum TaxID=2831512 RepID=A0AAN6RXQ9_9PEZI|nr:hypothetical protein C8A05DRAFT_29775 [Staphylotrichum longicolle]
MSADLFALFGDAPQATSTPQHQQKQSNAASSTTPAPPASDPFSFLASGTSGPHPPSQPQLHSSQHQQSTTWPPFQQPATAHPGAWFASPVSELQPSNNGWEIFGASGDLASLQSLSTSFQTSQQPAPMEREDDDGWGDFEVASPNPPPPQPAAVPNTTSNPIRSRVTRASTIDMMTNKLVDLGLETSAPDPWETRPRWENSSQKPAPVKPAHNPNPDVLFDADFEADNPVTEDDDFGDFETGAPAAVDPQRSAPAKSALDLLSLDSTPTPAAPPPPRKQPPGLSLSNAALQASPASYPEAPKSPYGSFHERKPELVKRLQVQPPTMTKALKEANEASPSPVTAWPAVEADGFGNQWEEFKDLPDTTKPGTAAKSKPNAAVGSSSEWEWQDWGAAESQPAPAATTTTTTTTLPPSAAIGAKPGPPPTNIPPPATLLSLFPQLLDLASASLLKPLLTLSQSTPAYQRVLASEATFTFIKGYLALATVAARLIAGRKHRWHRDKFLAQGMAISAAPAAGAGGQRGMKLTSVDKSQAVHEDREATEVVNTWKRQVGRLRGVLAGVNAAQGVTLKVPEIATVMAVSTAKGVPTASKACVVCGLKRDERVAKVDIEVEDSFGEWWVEFWGHRECRNFWVGHEKELRQL